MVFYGSLFFSVISYRWLCKFLLPPRLREVAWDFAAFCAALSYGILRLGCYLGGCCWGRFSTVRWAVRYFNEHSVMPFLGIPVHPVQLSYEEYRRASPDPVLIGQESWQKGKELGERVPVP